MATTSIGPSGVTFPDSSSQVSAAVPGIRGQVFTSSGTFTVPTGVTAVKVTLCGGGGSGGAVGCAAGGGGGGAGVAIKYVTGLTPGGTVTVTVGGLTQTTSFGAYCSATGGGNGGANGGAPGAPGAGSGGDLNYAARNQFTTGITPGTCGGVQIQGGLGMLGGTSGFGSGNAIAASGYGNGGCGNNGNGGVFTGSPGVCIVEW